MEPNKKPSIYILGSSGFLGSKCIEYFYSRGFKVFANRVVDVTDLRQLKNVFEFLKPDVVINFAGVRAYPTIDWCEDHKEETIAVNVVGATNAMLAALEVEAYPIQISSGCVYSGGLEHFFTENDEPNFYGSFYSRMRIILQKTLVELPILYARIRMPISSYSHPRNFINKIASYQKVISIPNSLTLIEDLWPALEKLIQIRLTGVLNLTNEGYIEHRQVLGLYRKLVDSNHKYTRISLDELEGSGGITKTKRSNCILSVEKAKSLGIVMPRLDDLRLEEIMMKFRASLNLTT